MVLCITIRALAVIIEDIATLLNPLPPGVAPIVRTLLIPNWTIKGVCEGL